MMRSRVIAVAVCFFMFSSVSGIAQDTLAHWSFNENSGNTAEESISKIDFSITNVRNTAEWVRSVVGNGLRTDGYSTVISGNLTSPLHKPASLTGWFALETYPTDTAGFFALSDSNSKNWISACVDKFGKPLIGLSINGSVQYFGADVIVPRFQWLFVCLSLQINKIELIINGKKFKSIFLRDTDFASRFDKIRMGGDERTKSLNIFPVTAINGIIDEVTVWKKSLSPTDIVKSNITERFKKIPDLSIPEIRFKNDFNRPKYHLLPVANWTNETHGLIYFNGRYHLFNQKNGTNVFLGQINWGHFSSPDLIRWTEHRPVLTPEPGYDQIGIWSGHCVLNDEGKPTIMYTGGSGNDFGMCLAEPLDSSLLQWKKYSGNPVVKGPPKQFSRIDFRDPYLWKEANTWYMIIGFGLVENTVEKGTVLLYKSTDLKNWQYLHPLFVGDPEKDDSGIFWEMPVFWKMNGKYILLVNKVPQGIKPAVALYWTGDFKNEKFVPDHQIPRRLEIVNRLLSPSVTLDEEGRSTAIAIIPDEISAQAQYQQGWTHVYSIPRVWTLEDGRINQQPHPNLKKLRKNMSDFEPRIINPQTNLVLNRGKHQVEIKVQLIPKDCRKFGFVVGKDPDQKEFGRIYFDFEKQQIIVDQTQSSKKEFIPLEVRTGDYFLNNNQKIEIHLFIDGSAIEVFINNKDALTTRLFPAYASSSDVEVFVEGGYLQLVKAEVWELMDATNRSEF